MATKPNITDLKKTIVDAELVAQQLVADKYQGASQFVVGLRGQLSAAATLAEEHEKWVAANPAPAEKADTNKAA